MIIPYYYYSLLSFPVIIITFPPPAIYLQRVHLKV